MPFKYNVNFTGALWFQDLTKPDPTYILPAVTGLTMLASVELNAYTFQGQDNAETMRYVFRALSVALPAMTYHFAAAYFVHFLTTNVWMMGQVGLDDVNGR